VLVSATFDGPTTTAAAHATGDSALGGYQSTVAGVKLLPNVAARADSGTTIHAGGDVSILATATNNASSTADGSSVSLGFGAGGTSATATIGGATLAFTLNANFLVAD